MGRQDVVMAVDPYWGGWTECGRKLHYFVGYAGGPMAVSACGRFLDGGTYEIPEDVLLTQARCVHCLRRASEG